MIEASGTYAGTHYYHYDALGSIVAMTNSAGNVTQLYEYSVYGQVAASDADHPNRFMFTGREFDKDTGLYYYRARYYHPEIGRFLQTDPIGYGDGMNWYAYCKNNGVNGRDPLGLLTNATSQPTTYEAIIKRAINSRVRNSDPVGKGYFCQTGRMTCSWDSVANLYISLQMEGHVIQQIVAECGDGVLAGTLPVNRIPGYCMDRMEIALGLPDTVFQPDQDWELFGVPSLSPVASVINHIGGIGTYGHSVKNKTPVTPSKTQIDSCIRPHADGQGHPIIMEVRTGTPSTRGYHIVVVRWCAGAESMINGKWVSTPYEIIDGMNGVNEQLYLTEDEFRSLLSENIVGQAILPLKHTEYVADPIVETL
jgi:RHS repeat-associated protein